MSTDQIYMTHLITLTKSPKCIKLHTIIIIAQYKCHNFNIFKYTRILCSAQTKMARFKVPLIILNSNINCIVTQVKLSHEDSIMVCCQVVIESTEITVQRSVTVD